MPQETLQVNYSNGLKLGDKVTVENKLIRTEEINHEKYFYDKVWQEKDIQPVTGIFLGWRTLSNGNRYADMTYRPTQHFRAAFVCTSARKNPFYSTAIQETS